MCGGADQDVAILLDQPTHGTPLGPGCFWEPSSAADGITAWLRHLCCCRAVGQQIWTTGSDGQYANTGAQTDLWCGPGSAKIAIKHFFSNTTTGNEVSRLQCSAMRAIQGGVSMLRMQCSEACWLKAVPLATLCRLTATAGCPGVTPE